MDDEEVASQTLEEKKATKNMFITKKKLHKQDSCL